MTETVTGSSPAWSAQIRSRAMSPAKLLTSTFESWMTPVISLKKSYLLYSFFGAAVANDHRLGGLNTTEANTLPVLEARSLSKLFVGLTHHGGFERGPAPSLLPASGAARDPGCSLPCRCPSPIFAFIVSGPQFLSPCKDTNHR